MTTPAVPRRRRRPVRGALMVLAGMLAVSGAIRLGLGLNEARALVTPGVPSPAAAACEPVPGALAEALRQREDRVSVRETALADRLSALALAEQKVTARIAELEAAESALAATLQQVDGAAETDLARLTEVYEQMKPKDAATLFAAMSPEFAAGFLARMRPDSAAAVLAGMPADSGYAVSVLLAGRHALVPRQ